MANHLSAPACSLSSNAARVAQAEQARQRIEQGKPVNEQMEQADQQSAYQPAAAPTGSTAAPCRVAAPTPLPPLPAALARLKQPLPLLLFLLLLWTIPGLIGHDPWKPDEAYSMGLILHILETGDNLVPTLAGEPFMEKPPLYFITAALLTRLLPDSLPLHDAARLTSGLFMALTFLCLGLSARQLFGTGSGWLAPMLLMGALGLLPHAHQMITDTALLAGYSLALLGMTLSATQPIVAGLLLGTGVGSAFLAKGLLVPLLYSALCALLLLFPGWRHKNFFLTLLLAALSALPWLLIWPLSLYQQSPELFDVWFWQNNLGRFLGSSHLATSQERGYYLKALLWFSGPVLPMALYHLWQQRRCWRAWLNRSAPGEPLLLPLLLSAVVSLTLFASSATRSLYLLPLLPPLVLLATPLLRQPQPAPRWGIRTVTWLFTGTAGVIWLVWLLALASAFASGQWNMAGFAESFVIPDQEGILFRWSTFLPAAAATLLAWQCRPLLQLSQRALLSGWSAGITLVWLLLMTLWLPVIDYGKTYRGVFAELGQAVAQTEAHCIGSRNLGEPQRAMLHYFGQIKTKRLETGWPESGCPLVLWQYSLDRSERPHFSGTTIWQGERPGDTKERYLLYRPSLESSVPSIQKKE
ncbi:ArnT family glycosyltransferase [Candidatus Magnetaquicoccus inordinatus]|uniref:ArnT family glycosyltransferase n=1 Tax=Candidatus Magnetaquicoccus inordinatus TaxID=2496818 RepID=UPI00102B0A08|nr:glycosyltransferase family 39 protein [Candidatus Magnetaquicoccus inordinatus]